MSPWTSWCASSHATPSGWPAEVADRATMVESCSLLERVIDVKCERAELRGQVDTLIGIIEHLAFENFILRRMLDERIRTDGDRTRRRNVRRPAAA
jgi:hypothetical protein